MRAATAMNLFLNLLCLAAVIFYLWRYFGFVGFDLTKFRPPSALSRIGNVFLAVGLPLVGLSFAMEDKQKRIVVGVGISTILVSAILPDLEPPEARSAMQWGYFRTVGKWIADFTGTGLVYVVLLVCWAFGNYWAAAYAGIAIVLGIGRSIWIA